MKSLLSPIHFQVSVYGRYFVNHSEAKLFCGVLSLINGGFYILFSLFVFRRVQLNNVWIVNIQVVHCSTVWWSCLNQKQIKPFIKCLKIFRKDTEGFPTLILKYYYIFRPTITVTWLIINNMLSNKISSFITNMSGLACCKHCNISLNTTGIFDIFILKQDCNLNPCWE